MIPAHSQTSLVEEIPQLDGHIPAEQFFSTSPWIIGLCIAGGLLVLGGLGLWWNRWRKHRHLPSPPSPLDICSARLDELEAALPNMRECCMRLSLIIREFLEGQVQDTSLFETHEEFTQRIDSLTTLPPACRAETQTLLNTLAEHKYTGESDDNPTLERDLIDRTRHLFLRIINEQQQDEASRKLHTAQAS